MHLDASGQGSFFEVVQHFELHMLIVCKEIKHLSKLQSKEICIKDQDPLALQNTLPSENGCAVLSDPPNFFVLSLKSDLIPLSSFTPSPQTSQACALRAGDHSPPQLRGVFPSLISLRRLPSACLLLLKQLISLKLFVFPTGLHFNALGLNFNNKGST